MNSVIEYLIKHKTEIPQKIAIISQNEKYTYEHLVKEIEHVANYLTSKGIKSGDRVLLKAVGKAEFVICFFAVQYIGAIAIPVDRTIKPDSLVYIINKVGAKLFINSNKKISSEINTVCYDDVFSTVRQKSYEQVGNNTVEITDVDICEVIFSTGTTGNPKGAMHSKKAIVSNTYNTIRGVGLVDSDVILLSLPLSHSFGLRVLRACLVVGATVVIQEGASFAKETAKNIIEYSCTGFACVVASMKMMIEQLGEKVATEVFGNLRFIEFSAGAIDNHYRKYLVNLLPNTDIHNTWGSTETGGCFFINLSKQENKDKSMGKPLDLIQTKIIDCDTGLEIVQTGEQYYGKLAIKGDMLMNGYWGDEILTRSALQDGWLITNDMVWRDDEGYYYILGRSDDMINVGGEKVYPAEIESIAMKSSYISECACVGVLDLEGHMGEIPILFVCKDKQCTDSSWKEKLLKLLMSHLEQHKVPKKIVEMELLPRNKMGKVNRKELRDNWSQNKSETSVNPIIKNILSRRSVRKFTDKDVSERIVEKLVECGKSAPSGKNLHTRRFIVLKSEEEIKNFKKIISEVAEQKGMAVNGFFNPKVLVIISDDRRNKDGIQDVSCAAENIMLGANSYGLGSVWLNVLMDLCDETQIRECLTKYKIPQKHWVWATVAIGWPDEEEVFTVRKEDTVIYF